MTLLALTHKLRDSWGADTSADAENWTRLNPSVGQCAVTALIVQDHFGGELLRSTVDGVSHYWNRLPNDAGEIDLTLQQFGGSSYDAPGVVRDRDYVLSFPATAARYELLRKRVAS